ncbi:IclR family transcriptional regulator [Nocardioides cavernae]|uniref:IclR family transcriptional regulator n=1 Tax=Nocardioides cavernae TaxID=1921566 RepID=A0ABR8N9F7_9ACTN|nr:IclR family transcriptional regulator [Nocardioides cavernae]MBD3924226.1 IclR family transcriptional regulator [Nocardioides cavernae]MBM7510835.1 IclR family pca regulon transcriptional regulator [Nocardioides cavernae]
MVHDANQSPKSNTEGGIQSVARALSILELFDDRRPLITTNEIASLTGLNRGTAYRFCQTLRKLGYLEEVRQSTFRPGLKVLSLAQAALGGRGLVDLATPRLQQLRHDTGETVNLAQPDGNEVVYVARLLNDDLLALRLVVGSRLPMVSSSLGRAILAFMPPDARDAVLDSSDFPKLTTHTLTDRARLMDRLKEIRERGYALNDQEVAVGVRGVAAPVLGAGGVPIASINLSIARPLSTEDLEKLTPMLLDAARDIGRRVESIDKFGEQVS